MQRADLDSAVRRVRDIRLALAGLLVLSMTANLALTVGFAGRETATVLLPAAAGPEWRVGGRGMGPAATRYLEDMARTVAVTLLTLTPENAGHVRLAAARLSHASARGAIGAWVEAEAARMAGRDLASAFYPDSIEADPERLTVEISGELVTWIGREEAAREDRALPARLPHGCRAHRPAAFRTDGGLRMTRICRRLRVVACLMFTGALALSAPAAAMQLLEAVDHAELSAEISAVEINRIALLGDRVLRVVRAPDGFAVEHDAATGDLWLRRVATAAPDDTPVTLFLGTEKGFTYRLTLTPSARDAAQILIRNADALSKDLASTAIPAAADPHIAALVKLVRSVARRETLPGYSIHAGRSSAAGVRLIETWRGPRFLALVLEADPLPSAAAAGAWPGPGSGPAGLARTIADALAGGRVRALWLAAPGTGPKGGRLAVAVVEPSASGEPR